MANEELEALNQSGNQVMDLFHRALSYAHVFQIIDKTTFDEAFDNIRSAKAHLLALEAQAHKITGPLQQVIDEVNASLYPKREALNQFVSLMKQKTVAFNEQAQQRAFQAQQQAQALLNQHNAGQVVSLVDQRQAIQQIDDARPEKPEGVSFVTYPHYEVTDLEALPAQFTKKVVDKAACNAYAKEHKGDPNKSLPGLRLYTTQSPTVR